MMYVCYRKNAVGDGDINYNITIQDARYDHNYHTLWGRLKRAVKILFGKSIYYIEKKGGCPFLFLWGK